MNSKNIFRILSAVAISAVVQTSCTEKIDLKLKNSSPQLVIEGSLNNNPGPYFVYISKSKLYYQDNTFTGVSSATVVISDDAGNRDTLTETIAGIYQSHTLQGTVGRTYKLEVTTEGTTYVSLCYMPTPVDIDSIQLTTETDRKGNTKNIANILVRDPAGVQNQYRVISYLNDTISDGFHIHSDRLWDGKLRSFGVPQSDFKTGDSLRVDLQSIDAHIYTYFNQFNQNQNNFGAPAAPANPDPVYTPAALGYFTAYSVKTKAVVIP